MNGSEPHVVLGTWRDEWPRVPVLDLRPEPSFLHRRLSGSANIPLGELRSRMFALPPPTSPLAVILPCASDYHVVPEEAAELLRASVREDAAAEAASAAASSSSAHQDRQGELPAAGARPPSTPPPPRVSGLPVFLKGCSTVPEFLSTRGGSEVRWYLQDSEQLWETAEQLGLLEAPVLASDHRGIARLRRRFLFKPCPLLERLLDGIEWQLVSRSFCTSGPDLRPAGGTAEALGSPAVEGAAVGSDVAEAADGKQPPVPERKPRPGSDVAEAAGGKQPPMPERKPGPGSDSPGVSTDAGATADGAHPQRRSLQLRCLEPGCGSGRNLAWLASREVVVRLDDGTEVDVSWTVVGLDFWYGALVRLQELCGAAGLPAEQVVLHHCEIEAATGALVGLPAPSASCKHHEVPRTYIRAADPTVPLSLEPGAFDLVLCVRFLSRAFNPRIPELLSTGGFVLFNTFLDMAGTRAFGRPSGEGHLLQPGELRSCFEAGFTVLCDEVEVEEHFGRELCVFLACKNRPGEAGEQRGPGLVGLAALRELVVVASAARASIGKGVECELEGSGPLEVDARDGG